MQKKCVVGVDIGGTKIRAALIKSGEIIKSFTIETESSQSKDHILNNLQIAISKVIIKETEAIGIGSPGIIDSSKGIINEIANIPAWKNIHLSEIIEDKFARKVYLNNDANCFVLGNKIFGTGKSYRNIVGITLGTGLGAGIIANNKLYTGSENGAGEFGQLPYLDSNYETYCSSNFFSTIKHLESELTSKKAEQGDKDAIKVWKEFGYHLGKLTQVILYTYAPELIVFGGSVSKSHQFFYAEIESRLAELELKSLAESVKITFDINSNSSVLGAAALCFVD